MRKYLILAVAGLTLAGATCTPEQRMIVGGLAGAGVALVAADVLNTDPDWNILVALAGAAAGTVVARNLATGECAISNGDGTYRKGPC